MEVRLYTRKYFDRELAAMKQDSSHLVDEWKDLQRNIAVDTGDFENPKSNKRKRKDPYYTHSINGKARKYSKLLAALMVAYMTPQRIRWYEYDFNNGDNTYDESKFLRNAEDKTNKIFTRGKLYATLYNVAYEALIYGVGVGIIKKDFKNVIRFEPLTIGQYWIKEDANGDVRHVIRKFAMSTYNMLQQFGIGAMPKAVMQQINKGELNDLWVIYHAVEPNLSFLPYSDSAYNKPFISAYWLDDADMSNLDDKDKFIEKKGISYFPYFAWRWDKFGINEYGTGIGRESLGDIKMLQSYERDLAKASKKKIAPTLKARPNMKKHEKDIGAEAIIYTDDPDSITPLFNVNYDTIPATQNIERIEARLAEMFYIDAFFAMMTANKTMSATEASGRQEEKLAMLGAVVDRAHTEVLPHICETTFKIAHEAGEFGQMPESMAGGEIDVTYKSVLAQSLEMTDLSLTERWMQVNNALAAMDPRIAKLPKIFEISRYFASKLGVKVDLMNTDEEIAKQEEQENAVREEQAKESASKTMLNQAKATQALANSPTSGANALSEMLRS